MLKLGFWVWLVTVLAKIADLVFVTVIVIATARYMGVNL